MLYSAVESGPNTFHVGIATKLKQRVQQHLVRRDSSVATGVSAVSLLSDHVTGLSWWEHPTFLDNAALKAAELIAFDTLNPIMRSRGKTEDAATEQLQDREFTKDMERLFSEEPTGGVKFLTLSDAMDRIRTLESSLRELERQIQELKCLKDAS
jgi:hypothetical protein